MNNENGFESILNNDNLLRSIYSYGFENPSPIQSKSIPIIKSGKDLIAQAQSGTGKTGAFSIGILNSITTDSNHIQKLILAPTHELAKQIMDVLHALSQYMKIKIELIVGKTSISDSINRLSTNPQIVIGTPGRILDMINRKYLYTDKITTFILDEADEVLSSGFLDSIYNIIKSIPTDCQICLFSATIPDDILTLSQKFMNNPEQILINKELLTLEGIKQYYVAVDNYNWKFDVIMDIYDKLNINQCIIYINTKSTLEQLYSTLKRNEFPVSYITSDLTSIERNNILNEFKTGNIRVLLSTDLLSRGIDIQQLSLVINFDLPNDNSTYIHRIGRSGRYGRKGTAINIVSHSEYNKLDALKHHYNTTIDELPNNINDII